MSRLPLVIVFAISTLVAACQPEPSRRSPPTRPEVETSISFRSLYRDRVTARSFVGRLVNIELAPKDYSVHPGELRIAATIPGAPPVLVIRTPHTLALPLPALSISGRVVEVRMDGTQRTTFADFVVLFDAVSVTVR